MNKRRIDDYLKHGDIRRKITHEPTDESILNRLDIILNEIKELKDRIEAIETVLEDINSRMLSLEERLDKLNYSRRPGKSSSRHGIQQLLLKILRKEAYIIASEVKAKIGIQPSKLLNEAYSLENVNVIEAGGEAIIISDDKLDEFKRKLASIETSDPFEAEERLGIYKSLFSILRRSGMLYYDGKAKMWKMLE